ncbi:amino acid permease-domain-containing protein [Scheffersomyces coipomensis]|uniref:amino acid permease-domain-containing protein n=1 Tax=Scheffersomyces coipomensis TaxID=1788519 RepID=UPI00315DD9C3
MTHLGSDTNSDDSESSIMEHRLFPTMEDKHKDVASSEVSSRNSYHLDSLGNDSTSSIGDLRHIFVRHHQTDNQYNQAYEDDDTEQDLTDVATFESHNYSIDSSIINQITHNPDHLDKIDNSGERFKYLRGYEKLKKDKIKQVEIDQTVQNMKDHQQIPLQVLESHSSVFELSQLDDFNKYIKQTELNDIIYAKVAKNLPPKENDLLNVVQSKELSKNFYADHDFTNETKTNILKPSTIKLKTWYGRKYSNTTGDRPVTSKISISELNYSNSPSSSDTADRANKIYLQRKLKVRHLQMISLGGTLGVGLFLNSGKALTIAGGFGTLLAYVVCGIIVLATMVSFCEMVTFVSVVDGVSGLSSRFVDDAFGFAVGWLYFVSFSFGLAGEIVASVIMLSYYPYLNIPADKGSSAGFVTLFLTIVVLSNLIDVRIFGEIEYISSFIKLIAALIMIIVMIVLNRGGFGSGEAIGFRFWNHSKSDFDHNIIFGLFRPRFNLHDTGTNPPDEGIGGGEGRFLSFLVALLVVSYAYSGTEIVCIAACEAQNPRKALPSATKRVFWRILLFYCLSAFCVSLNVYAGDPRLLRYYSGNTGIAQDQFAANYAIEYAGGVNCNTESLVFAGFGTGAQSPWIVALQSAGLCNFSSVVNGFLVFFAISCGNAQLYVSSRTVYSMALQRKAPKFLTYCNAQGIPYNAVLFAASFGLLSYLCVSEKATVVFQNLTSIIASSGIMVWFAMCLSFIRFYYGLKRRPDIINRDDKAYPYRSPFQPYSAIIGLIGTTVIIFGMGFVVFIRGEWNTMFFFSSYGTLIIFAVLYIGYKVVRGTRIPTLDTIDFDSGRTEMDRFIWDGGREYNARSVKDTLSKFISFLA